jgi:hypothetical protein
MHASLAFVNGAGDRRRPSGSRTEGEELRLLNTLLSTATSRSPRPPSNPNEVRERHLNKIKR